MQYLKQLVSHYNLAIQATLDDPRFEGSSFHGLVNYVEREGLVVPVLTDNYDVNQYVGVDDTQPIIIYHAAGNIAYADVPARSFGDEIVKRETDSMRAIVYANRAKVRMTPEEVEAAIISSFPIISKADRIEYKLKTVIFRPVSSNLNPRSVWAQEYPGQDFALPPNGILISINYAIESTYNISCFSLCDCN
ncbi:MAG TPA: hypothetical protein PLI89_12640 [Chitinophagales bacterium]|nr:hypothetical protein [Chitinophagales bacterium]